MMTSMTQFAAVNPAISLAAMHARMVVFAQDEQGHLKHVDDARRGKACNCRCLACGEALIARQGDIKAHSFAHESGTDCQYAIDAMWNALAAELIAARGRFGTPALKVRVAREGPRSVAKASETIPCKLLRVDSVSVDRRLHPQRPSVAMLVQGRELILEVTHGHRLDAHKRAAIEKLSLPAIELHLAETSCETIEEFEQLLLGESALKHWIFNPKARGIEAQLDAAVQGQLEQQQAQHAQQAERQREEQAAREAAAMSRKEAERAAIEAHWRQQAERDHLVRQAQAQAERAAKAELQAPAPVRVQQLHYRMADGGLTIRHGQDGALLIIADTGREQALATLAGLGLNYDAERGGYPATILALKDLLPALAPYVKSVRSI